MFVCVWVRDIFSTAILDCGETEAFESRNMSFYPKDSQIKDMTLVMFSCYEGRSIPNDCCWKRNDESFYCSCRKFCFYPLELWDIQLWDVCYRSYTIEIDGVLFEVFKTENCHWHILWIIHRSHHEQLLVGTILNRRNSSSVKHLWILNVCSPATVSA